MNMTVLFQSMTTNVLWTIGTVVILFVIFMLERSYLKRNEETVGKVMLILVFITSFVLLAAGIGGILWVWGFDLATYFDVLGDDIILKLSQSVGAMVSSVVVLFVALFLLRISKLTSQRIIAKANAQQRRRKTVVRLIRSITKYIVWITAILVILSIWGLNVAPALAGLGIMGLVIGLGAQRFINDLISGFFIVFEQHFDVGDKIEVQGFKGEVIDIGLKTTKIRNWKGEIKIFSNGELSNLINFSKELSTALVEFGIAYGENMQSTIDMLNAELPKMKLEHPEIVEDPKVLGVVDLASSSVNMRVMAKTLNEQHYAVERAMRKRIKELLDEHGIEIPFPQVVVHQPVKKIAK